MGFHLFFSEQFVQLWPRPFAGSSSLFSFVVDQHRASSRNCCFVLEDKKFVFLKSAMMEISDYLSLISCFCAFSQALLYFFY